MSKYVFRPFVLDPISRRLWREGETVAITARVFDILVVLVGRGGQPVDRDVLIEQVWGDLAVEEGNLSRNVSTLRKLLGESPDDHRYIVTLPGRGYQFVAAVEKLPAEKLPVEILPADPPASSRARRLAQVVTLAIAGCVMMAVATVYAVTRPKPRAGADRVPRISVLPFENLGRDDDQHVAAGLTEEITSRLAAVDRLQLVSRAGAARYDRTSRRAGEIGAALGADYLLDGSIAFDRDRAPADGRIRIAARLIHASDDTLVWAETFDRDTGDPFRMQAEIATRVVRALRGELVAGEDGSTSHLSQMPQMPRVSEPPRRSTQNSDAWKAYLRGVFHANRPDISDDAIASAIAQFERATAIDPGFAIAHAKLSTMQTQYYMFGYDASRERLALARQALERALTLDPGLPEAQLAASSYWLTAGDLAKALAAAESAERLRPNDAATLSATAGVLWRCHAERALALMPHPRAFDASTVREDAALTFTMAGAHDAALDQISILLATPAHFSVQSLRLDPRWDPLRTHPRYREFITPDPSP